MSFLVSGCAARTINLPTDAGDPLPGHDQVLAALTGSCRNVRTMTAELGLSGNADGEGVRGRAIAGFERPSSMRLEGVGPFGQVGFILATRGEDAVLLLPREERVVRGARAEAILGRLTGVAFSPADLLAILTGCVVPAPMSASGRTHANGWVSLDLTGGATLWARQTDGRWQLQAARRDGWQIEYRHGQDTFPAAVRLRSMDPAVDLTATLSQVESNVEIDPAAFRVDVPRDTIAITVDELRGVGALRGND